MYSLGEIALLIDAELIGDSNLEIKSLASIDTAKSQQLSYIVSNKYANKLLNTQADAVIINNSAKSFCKTNALIVADTHLAFAKLSHYFKPKTYNRNGIHASAKTNGADIADNCCIGKNTVIGKGTIIGANTVIEDNTIIGSNCNIGTNVSILRDSKIGNKVIISSGAVIGSEGFSNALDTNKKWIHIAHLGSVIIGDNVIIGANTTIDRGSLGDTHIHHGVRMDNIIHIAHNVTIGEDTAIAAGVCIAGSTTIGKRCMIGGMVGIMGHANICDDVIINAKSAVDKSISVPGKYTGIMPLMPHKKWQTVGIWLIKLDKITKYLNIKLKHLKGS
jgi:UDP-3-O-[3-hydroxymyristoyl] glucosamine N-acyltransferase